MTLPPKDSTDDDTQSVLHAFVRNSKIISMTCIALAITTIGLSYKSPNGISSFRSQHELHHPLRILSKEGRIVGGSESAKGQFPFMVSLRDGDKEWSWATCGGSLISPSIVLTAAHCIGTMTIADYNRFNQNDDSGIQRFYLSDKDIIGHEKYDHESLDNDFALVRLPEPVKDPEIIPLNQDASLPRANSKPRVIGWGRTEFNGDPSPVQKYADLDYVEQDECLDQFGGQYITEHMLCAYSEGVDACQGDSGGPLILMNDKGEDVQVGVVSWGAGCASKYPGVYSRVHTAIDWINEKVCQGKDALAPQDCDGDVLKGTQSGSSSTDKKAGKTVEGDSSCKDKSSFKSKHKGDSITCAYVAKSKLSRCKIYKEECPETCGTCSGTE